MTTVAIEYVGKKEAGETDHLYGTGITWAAPGDVQDVPDDKAPLLLNHPDVWRDGRSKAAQKKDPIEPKTHTSQRFEDHAIEHTVAAKIHLMPDTDMRRYAVTEFNEHLDPALTEDQVRAEVTRLIHTRT